MAIARALFVGLLILVIALGVVGLLLPGYAHVEREILIEARPAAVFPHLNDLRAFNAWSPWAQKSADTRYEFSGPQSGVGARMRWESGDAGVGSGTQEIIASEPDRRVVSRLNFGEQGQGTATWDLYPAASGSRLIWTFDTEFGWDLIGRYAGLFLDGLIGTEYETGLQRLKERIESDTE
jgi:uncharacterized protein YndB with AHSA1/START domain